MTIESKGDLTAMRAVGKLVAKALREMRAGLRPGMTTQQLDDVGAVYLRRHGARSAPQLAYGFPGFNCISVNDEIVHGVPLSLIHISEPTRLLSISYAVFCLKKKTKQS